MSYSAKKDFRDILINNSNLTSLVKAEDIRVVFKRDELNFPSIIIIQVAGKDEAMTGYMSSPQGQKTRTESCSFQLNIYSRNSIAELENINDAISTALSADTDSLKGLVKTSDLDSYYDSDLGAYIKIVTWNFFHYITD